MNSQGSPGTLAAWRQFAYWVGGPALVLIALLLCFCTRVSVLLALSFVFNGLLLGSSLFAALAQEREKRTIDALRLTQLSSLEILLLKSRKELRSWALGNLVLSGLTLVAAGFGGGPWAWVVLGSLAMAACGLLSISLALAVSTHCETTSSAVVQGWVVKGAWLVGFPLLDQVVEAVLVSETPVRLFSHLDPAWLAWKVSDATFFELPHAGLLGLLFSVLGCLGLSALIVTRSARVIDRSFESPSTLNDRQRHLVYTQNFPGGLHENPFFLREMAWQLRSGAGRWPGYAVFVTLFLAPFLYGLAQVGKGEASVAPKVLRLDPGIQVKVEPTPASIPGNLDRGTFQRSRPPVAAAPAELVPCRHRGLCLSLAFGWVDRGRSVISRQTSVRQVVLPDGRLSTVTPKQLQEMRNASSSGSAGLTLRDQLTSGRSFLQNEMSRSLHLGLLLTILYLFVRGGAFMASSVTGEKERRAWDQIALTGATPQSVAQGKLVGALCLPLRQLLMSSPVLLLFVLFGVISLVQALATTVLLATCLVTAALVGLACSVWCRSSHAAQGMALLLAAGYLLLPLLPGMNLLLVLGVAAWFPRLPLDQPTRVLGTFSLLLGLAMGGSVFSPLGAVLGPNHGQYISTSVVRLSGSDTLGLFWSTVFTAVLGWIAYQLALRGLESGGSLRGD